ncbi:MAG: hypothetical protein U9R58_12405 [Chloroflexota bacterium]|nr:hypothetical protein [Chloroflexota bacterium]
MSDIIPHPTLLPVNEYQDDTLHLVRHVIVRNGILTYETIAWLTDH